MKKTHLTLIAVLTLFALITSCTPAQPRTDNAAIRQLNVSGTGLVELEPDIARVNIGIRTQSPNVGDALDENNAIAEAIIQNLMSLGIEENDIQTRNFNVSPDRSPRPEREDEEPQSFGVENTVSVVVRDFNALGEILASSIAEIQNSAVILGSFSEIPIAFKTGVITEATEFSGYVETLIASEKSDKRAVSEFFHWTL